MERRKNEEVKGVRKRGEVRIQVCTLHFYSDLHGTITNVTHKTSIGAAHCLIMRTTHALIAILSVAFVATAAAHKETVLGRLQHAVENRGLNFLKMVRGVDAKTNFTSETVSTSHTGYDHEEMKKKIAAIDFVDFSASQDILAVRQNIQKVLKKARKTMRKGFMKLEKEVMSKLSTVLDQVCGDDEGKECWASNKAQCELLAVKEYVQEKRCELASHALEGVRNIKRDFDQYIKARYSEYLDSPEKKNPKWCNCQQTAQDIVNQRFIDGMLGEYQLDPTTVDSQPEMFEDTDFQMCMGDAMMKPGARKWKQMRRGGFKRLCFNGRGNFTIGKRSTGDRAGVVEKCVSQFKGMEGLITYYGGQPAVAPNTCSDLKDEFGGSNKGRLGG